MTDLLIIGGVAAGATAAARARRLNGDIKITILEAGPDVSFANCGLPYYIGGDIEYRSSLILASPETFDDQYKVAVHTNTEAVSIDRKKHEVRAKNTKTGKKQTFRYDRLILAQGGKPIVPPLPGADRENVFSLWTLEDMDAIDSFISERDPRTAVVVGGGFIGLEMVEALAKRGLSVRLVEMAPHVMPNMDAEFAGALQKEIADYGVAMHIATSLSEIGENEVVLSDGSRHGADMVLLSIGVRPTLKLAEETGLEIGEAGGLKVSDRLQTSDEAIFAAGDMAEIEHRVADRTVRIPLAGPANRQGRIAAENALGGSRSYNGAMGTSVVKLFGMTAGSVGLSRSAAAQAGIDAEAVVVHKASHTAYFPGSEKVSLMLTYERESGRVLGAQAVGRVGVDKRLDVLATAILGKLTIDDLQELDLAYAPPFNSPNGPVNMAAFTASNKRSGFSPAILASEVEQWVFAHEPIAIDLRDPISFGRAHLEGSTNISQGRLRENMDRIPKEQAILVISEDGQKGHVALRMLAAAGFEKVVNLSGGYISLERYARAAGFEQLQVGLLPVERKSVADLHAGEGGAGGAAARGGAGGAGGAATRGGEDGAGGAADGAVEEGPLILDVRTPGEFQMGAYPGAVNVGLDELTSRVDEFGSRDREIVVYCASGARSSYAQRLLEQAGFTNVRNGGGLHQMMAGV
ncbi:MAG: FAD-dependent oxidoreductase [Spirochaetota bacterium]